MKTNDEGLTWPEWAAAAGCDPAVTGTLRDEWRTGVDPTEYRANPGKRDLLALGAGHVLLTPSDALDFERRWLAECRAHGEAKRKLETLEAKLTAALAAARADVGLHTNEMLYNNGYVDGLKAALAEVTGQHD